MIDVAILGAGGNMGRRITRSLKGHEGYTLRLIEPGERGCALIAERGLAVVEQEAGLRGADIVVFAVPDKIIRQVATDVVPRLDPGTSILFLDPAAIAAERIPRREDISCYVTHPTHPPLYSLLEEQNSEARKDYWGGGLATQAIVFAVAWEAHYQADAVEQLAVNMFAPVSQSYRITVDQMALLEPALSLARL